MDCGCQALPEIHGLAVQTMVQIPHEIMPALRYSQNPQVGKHKGNRANIAISGHHAFGNATWE